MEITNILDVSPEMASDIQYLWDETDMTSEQIAASGWPTRMSGHRWHPEYQQYPIRISLDVVQDILGGAYKYENHTD